MFSRINRNKTTEIAKYIAPMLSVGLLFLVILAIKGMYPFGSETIDYYDMAQQNEAYYHIYYDDLHFAKSVFFDWFTSLGRSTAGGTLISPFNLLLFLTARDSIMEFMSVMMLVKIMFMALTMYIFLKNICDNIPYLFSYSFSVGYGLCGYVLMNYTIPFWLDILVIVPLVLLFSQRCLGLGKSSLGLIISLFFLMSIRYYLTAMILIFIFLIGGAYILYNHLTERKRLYVLRFGCSVIAGILLPTFLWFPSAYEALTSARFSNGSGESSGLVDQYLTILRQIAPSYMARWWTLLGLSLPAAIIFIGFINDVKSKHLGRIIYSCSIICFVFLETVLESIHLIMHFGSYVNYPMRNGFLLYCAVVGIAAVYAADLHRLGIFTIGNEIGQQIARVAIPSVFLLAATSLLIFQYNRNPGIPVHRVFVITSISMFVLFGIYLLLLVFKKGAYRLTCVVVLFCEILFFGYIFIGMPTYASEYANDPEQEGEYIRISNQLVQAFDMQNEANYPSYYIDRIKNPDSSLNANYGMVMRRSTLSGWTSLAPADKLGGSVRLGYNSQYTRFLDSGANVFCDALLHATQTVSHIPQDERLYDKQGSASVVINHRTGEVSDYCLYNNRYVLPFGLRMNTSSFGDNIRNNDFPADPIDYFNEYYYALLPAEKINNAYITSPLFEYFSPADESVITGTKALYFCGGCVDTDYYNTRITVNGTTVPIPSIHENDNTLFPAHFNNNTVYLGSFSDEEVSIDIGMDITDPATQYDYYLYTIDLDVLKELCDDYDTDYVTHIGNTSLDMTLTAQEGESILLPLSYDNGWRVSVNNRPVEYEVINGLFMNIPLQEGDNAISLKYYPMPMLYALPISILTLVSIILILIVEKKKDLNSAPATVRTDRVLEWIYGGAFCIAAILIYIIPIAYAVLLKIKHFTIG